MTGVPQAVPQDPLRRYAISAIAFHWITAALVLLQIYLGLSFADMAKGPQRTELFTWHKSVGALILLLTLARLAYRLANAPPPFPPELPRWERIVAVWNHRLFYFLLIVLPLTGLVAVSAYATGPTTPLIGGIPLPVIPGISKGTSEMSGAVHSVLAWSLIVLLVLHVGAALKQQFYDRPGRMAGRMPPFPARTGEPVVSDARDLVG